MYKIFSGQENIRVGIDKNTSYEYFNRTYFKLFVDTIQNADKFGFRDYLRLFKCNVLNLVRVCTLLSIDVIKINTFCYTTGLDVKKVVQNPTPIPGAPPLLQRFSRFTAFCLGGYID